MVTTDTSQIPYLRDPDVQLMLRVQQGDDEAFSQLVAAYQDRIVGIFTHLVPSREMAEDLAQDVFMRVYRSRDSYKPEARFSTWLFRIANNLASNMRRSGGRRKEGPVSIRDSGPLGVRPQEKLIAEKSALMPTRQLAKRELCETVRAALDELNERQRMALLLHKFEGMSYDDIAATMEMSNAAVKSLLSRARAKLREKLEPIINHNH